MEGLSPLWCAINRFSMILKDYLGPSILTMLKNQQMDHIKLLLRENANIYKITKSGETAVHACVAANMMHIPPILFPLIRRHKAKTAVSTLIALKSLHLPVC